MTVFRYDRSFEGLLTALFDAYVRRTFPEALIGEGEPVPMFATEVYEVCTDSEKAARVWAGLQKKKCRGRCATCCCMSGFRRRRGAICC